MYYHLQSRCQKQNWYKLTAPKSKYTLLLYFFNNYEIDDLKNDRRLALI
jgi:hypothetical protein